MVIFLILNLAFFNFSETVLNLTFLNLNLTLTCIKLNFLNCLKLNVLNFLKSKYKLINCNYLLLIIVHATVPDDTFI